MAARDDCLAIGSELHGQDTIGIGVLDLGDLVKTLCDRAGGRQRRTERPLGGEFSVTCVPDFDRLVVRAGDDGFAVGREGNGADVVAVGVLLLRFELESACEEERRAVRSEATAADDRFNDPPASQTLIVPP